MKKFIKLTAGAIGVAGILFAVYEAGRTKGYAEATKDNDYDCVCKDGDRCCDYACGECNSSCSLNEAEEIIDNSEKEGVARPPVEDNSEDNSEKSDEADKSDSKTRRRFVKT